MTERIPLDNLTSDQLDQLYAERDQARTHADPELHDRLAAAINALGKSETELATHRAANTRVRNLAGRIRQGVPWTANDDDIADHILRALDEPDNPRTTPDNPATSDGTPPVHAGGNAENCPVCRPEIDKTVLYPWVCTEPDAAVDEADLTGYLAPDPPIGCLTVTAEPDPFGYEERERTGRNAGLAVEGEDATPPAAT